MTQDGFPASTTIYLTETITENSQYRHIVTEATDAQAFGSDIFEVDGLLLCRIFRDATNDTFSGTVHGLTADLHYQVAQLVTPDKRPPFF